MALAKVNGVTLHYEMEGSGDEVLLILNGIMMSTESWTASVPVYRSKFRVLRVDFRDQGQSEKMSQRIADGDTPPYGIEVHVGDLVALMDYLGIDKAHVMGISYGGEVAMLLALAHSDRVQKLILANTTARVTRHLRAVGESWEEAARLYDGEKFFKLTMPLIYSPTFYETHWQWLKDREKLFGTLLKQEWFDAYIRLSQSTWGYDILDMIHDISATTLCLAGDQDLVTPVEELEHIAARIPKADLVVMKGAGHASCYEKMALYNQLVMGFLAIE